MSRAEGEPVLLLLGPVELHVCGRPVDLGPPRLRLVLAALAVDAGRPVPLETLIGRVWGEYARPAARSGAYAYLTRLRRLLTGEAPRLVRRADGYLLDVEPERVDVERFRGLVRRARAAGEADSRADLLDRAVELWRGPALLGLVGEWAARTRDRLDQARVDALVAWAGAQLAVGAAGPVVERLRPLVEDYPLVEPVAARLIEALGRDGRTADALERYAATRCRLVAELGTEPGAELRALHQALLAGDLDGAPRAATPAVAVPAVAPRPAQLPPAVPGFTARAMQLAALDRLLQHRTGTAVISAIGGTAGIGKTTLAVHWAHRVAGRFPDGQLYVNLRGYQQGGQVVRPAQAVRGFLDALGVPPGRVPPDLDAQVALYRSLLAGRRVLLVLDNARDAEQVRPLLPGTPQAFVLVTSRNQLTPLVATDGARPLTLDLLTAAESRQLLEGRLGADRVAGEPAAVAQIVAACAGLPLALAVVAARATQNGLPLSVFATELADARLPALDAGDPATRLQAVFSWSYRALTPAAARLYRLLGLHPGPDLAAPVAASLVGLPPALTRPLLAELTRASMLAEQPPGRYAFHDLLRAYAAELAGTLDSEADRHAAIGRLLDHYVHAAHVADRLLSPERDPIPLAAPATGVMPEQPADSAAATAWLTAERRVLLAAAELAAEAGFDTQAWQLARLSDTFLDRRGHWPDLAAIWRTGLTAAERLGDLAVQGYAHRLLGLAHTRSGRPGPALHHLQLSLDRYARAGEPGGQAYTHHLIAMTQESQGQLDAALHHARQSLLLSCTAGHRRGQASALNLVGWYLTQLGDHHQALTHCQQALDLLAQLSDPDTTAATWDTLGYAHHQLGQHQQATTCYRHALELLRELGDRYNEAEILIHLGDTHDAAGESTAASTAWRQALAILTDLDHPAAAEVRARLEAR
jgi:DNA-binding SARP family transcriptional activator/tetratricopeptide (TPR) repeat protein